MIAYGTRGAQYAPCTAHRLTAVRTGKPGPVGSYSEVGVPEGPKKGCVVRIGRTEGQVGCFKMFLFKFSNEWGRMKEAQEGQRMISLNQC